MKFKTTTAFLLLALFGSNSHAYDEDGHYYALAMMALDVNGGKPLTPDLLKIIRAVQYVDDNPLTLPESNPFKGSLSETQIQSRRTFHFSGYLKATSFGYLYGTTKRDSPFARHNVNKALSTNDPYLLGTALHTYLDSFAHEGYTAPLGQVSGGHDADRPHLATDKFEQMVTMVYTILQKWQDNNGRPSNLNRVDPSRYKTLAAFVPAAYKPCAGGLSAVNPSAGCRDYAYQASEIAPRTKWWFDNINTIFPVGYLPQYSQFVGEEKSEVNSVVTNYQMPIDESLADNDQWDGISTSSYAAKLKTRSIQIEQGELMLATNGMTINELARFSLANVDLYVNGLDPRLYNEAGFLALLKAANRIPSGWFLLSGLSGAGDSRHLFPVSQRVYNQLLSGIKPNNIDKALFSLAAINSGDNGMVKSNPVQICNKAKYLYNELGRRKLTDKQRQLLISSIDSNSIWLSECGQSAIPTLVSLLSDPRLAETMAARFYLVSSDEERESVLAGDSSKQTAVRSLRKTLSDTLWNIAFEGNQLDAVDPVINENVKYWAIMSREDFDDNDHGSSSDKRHLQELGDQLRASLIAGNTGLASAVLNSLATYTPADGVPKILGSDLQMIISDNRFVDLRVTAAYALKKISGDNSKSLSEYFNQ